MLKKREKINRSLLSDVSVLFLKLGLLAVLMQLSILAIVASDTFPVDPFYVTAYYAPATEYVALSLTVVVCGTVGVDSLTKKVKK